MKLNRTNLLHRTRRGCYAAHFGPVSMSLKMKKEFNHGDYGGTEEFLYEPKMNYIPCKSYRSPSAHSAPLRGIKNVRLFKDSSHRVSETTEFS